MIRIWRISGQELTSISVDEISHVQDLKSSLRRLHGFPICMQQLLRDSISLDNATRLDASIDLQLVLLAPSASVAATELLEVCEAGNLEAVRALLEAGADSDFRGDHDSYTAIMSAAQNGHVEVAGLLLAAGADKDSQGGDGYTALGFAAANGHFEIARLLLEAGADMNKRTYHRWYTALMLAAMNGHIEIARLLLEAGADKDLCGVFGDTALIFAAAKGHFEIARLLLEAGADKDLRGEFGYTALMLAAKTGYVEVARLLLEADADRDLELPHSGDTALLLATEAGNVELAWLLVEAGADKSLRGEFGTALTLATKSGHMEIVRLLLEAGADTDSRVVLGAKSECECLVFENGRSVVGKLRDKDFGVELGLTALMLAAKMGHVEMARLLLEAGADKDLRGVFGNTFIVAPADGHFDIMKLRVEAGDQPLRDQPLRVLLGSTVLGVAAKGRNATSDAFARVLTEAGNTALLFATEAGNVEMARLLVEAGADKDLPGQFGYTALMLAAETGHEEMARLLLEAGADIDLREKFGYLMLRTYCPDVFPDPLASLHKQTLFFFCHLAAAARHISMGATALMLAAAKGYVDIVRLLLEGGAGKDLRTLCPDKGCMASLCTAQSALHIAAKNGSVEIVQLLLEARADTGLPALCMDMCAPHGKRRGAHDDLDGVQLLLEDGANKDAPDLRGSTALDVAVHAGHTEIAKLLSAKT